MNFKDLKDEDIELLIQTYYKEISHKEKIQILSEKFNVVGRSIRKWWQNLDLNGKSISMPPQLKVARKRSICNDVNVLIVAAAQNKTDVNLFAFNKILAYKKYIEDLGKKVELIIAPTRYRNPTSPQEAAKTKKVIRDEEGRIIDVDNSEWWADDVIPYLHYGKLHFGDTLISTESRVRPTAKQPLNGFEVFARDSHFVLPHSRIHFKTMPRFKGGSLRSMSTTGYITNKNYSDSKAGETAHEHHSFGFVIIEKKANGTCHMPRNVKMNSDGNFTDINNFVSDSGVEKIKDCEGMVLGDIHASEINEEVFTNTLKLMDIVKPKLTVIHDLFDGSSCNPHEVKDMYVQKRKIIEGRHLIDKEIGHTFLIVEALKAKTDKVYISLSNHDVFLDRLINDGNWKRDLHNSHNYLKYAHIQQTEDLTEFGTVYGFLLKQHFPIDDIVYMNYGHSLSINNYECALHGDNGSNGSRGSAKQFAKLNIKMIHGHTHSPVLLDGVTCVGVTCKISQYYTRKGLSSWAYAHSIIHKSGKNQLLVFGDDLQISDLI